MLRMGIKTPFNIRSLVLQNSPFYDHKLRLEGGRRKDKVLEVKHILRELSKPYEKSEMSE